jgi:hypothetical protein
VKGPTFKAWAKPPGVLCEGMKLLGNSLWLSTGRQNLLLPWLSYLSDLAVCSKSVLSPSQFHLPMATPLRSKQASRAGSVRDHPLHVELHQDNAQASHLLFPFSFFWGVLRFELRAYTLSHSTSSYFFGLSIFEIGSQELFAQAGFEPRSS